MSITRAMSGKCLIQAMESVMELCNAAHSVRGRANIRIRQPLGKMDIIDSERKWTWLAFAPDMVEIIKDECNVKQVFVITPDFRVEV